MINFLKAFPILLILFGTPILLIFGFGMKWYRSYQSKKYLKENADEIAQLEKQYNEIVDKAKK